MTSEPEAEQNLTEENGAVLEIRETRERKERHECSRRRSWLHYNNTTRGETHKQTDKQKHNGISTTTYWCNNTIWFDPVVETVS